MQLPVLIVIIPVDLVEVCNATAYSLDIAAPGDRVLMCDLVPADADEDAAVTHIGGRGSLGSTPEECEARRQALEAGMQAGSFPGAMFWRMDDGVNLSASHLGEAETQIGQPWRWPEALAAAGLQERTEGDVYPPDPA